jgi:hypothetical protein
MMAAEHEACCCVHDHGWHSQTPAAAVVVQGALQQQHQQRPVTERTILEMPSLCVPERTFSPTHSLCAVHICAVPMRMAKRSTKRLTSHMYMYIAIVTAPSVRACVVPRISVCCLWATPTAQIRLCQPTMSPTSPPSFNHRYSHSTAVLCRRSIYSQSGRHR